MSTKKVQILGTVIATDSTLTKSGEAADAKAVGDALANKQPKGNYLTEVPAEYAQKSELPTKTSDLQNDSGFISKIPDEYITDRELESKGYLTEHQDLSEYAKKTEIPSVPVQSVNGKTGAVELNATDVGALPDTTTIPTKTSDLANDLGFISEYTETDPTVPAWAKAAQKPSYTPEEIGAQPAGSYLTENDLSGYATKNFVTAKIAEAELSRSDVDSVQIGGENGVRLESEGEATNPVLMLYGAHGDEPVRIGQVAPAQADGEAVPLWQVKQLIEDSGQHLTLDDTLTNSGQAADAKAVGDEIKRVLEKIPSIEGLAKTEDIPTKPEDIGAQPKGDYLTTAPVASVNGKTGAVVLSASDVGARSADWMPTAEEVGSRPNTWTPTAQEVGALPNTYTPPNQTAAQVGADPKGTAASAVSSHNTNNTAHNDIRLLIEGLATRFNALANSTDTDLDQMAELVAYIKSNKSLIDGVTTSKVSVADIVNNLTTNVANKPLSAAQGVAMKALIDSLSTGKLDASKLTEAINTALAQAKANGEFDGKDGQRGTGLLPVTTAPASYTTAVGGITPKYRMAISTIKTQAGVTEVFLGDTIRYSYYHYPIAYLDASYAYCTTRVSIRGATGKTAYQYAQEGGYTGTEAEFSAKMSTPFVTPQMYGAVGDGVNDDTEYFERALAEHDHVFVPKGDYVISRPLNLAYKKSLFSEDGQNATIIYTGEKANSIVLVGRLTVFRNINVVVRDLFEGVVFDTHNFNQTTSSNGRHSKIEHVRVKFLVQSPKAVLIGITVDSGADANNIPLNTGCCYQTFRDIVVDGSAYYGTGIKMTLVQGRAFTEATKTGFPWMTHIVYDDVYLANPYTAIKAGVENTSGSEYFERIAMGHILFNNVTTQNQGIENTRYFFDVDHFSGYFSKCIGWDYHHTTNDYGEKVNIIGEGVNLSFSDCEMSFGQELLKCCDFTAETDSGFTVEDNPEYFMSKYFKGSFLSNGYDSVDAKIDAKLSGALVANIAEEKVNEILYSGFTNILDDPSTQIKPSSRFSGSSQEWKASNDNTTVIIPIVTGVNMIRWSPWAEATLSDFQTNKYALSQGYQSVFFFNDDELTEGVSLEEWTKLWVDNENGGYLQISNPNGYKYASLPFFAYQDISSETLTITINREITGNEGESYTEHLKERVVIPAVNEAVAKVTIPTKTSQLTNDSGFLTEHQSLDGYAKTADHYTKTESDNKYQPKGSYLTSVPSEYITEDELAAKKYLTAHQDISGKADKSSAETWVFTLDDGSTVTKKVVLA